MSLINDALKRAREQQKNPPPSVPPLRPFEPRKSGDAPQWILPSVIIFLIVAACFLIGLALAKRTVTQIERAPEAVSTTQAVEAVSAPVIREPSNAEPEIPAAPVLKVQGIVYDPVHPWAIINGKTVFVGDHLDSFRVKTINKNTVTLQAADGSETKLGL
jgi:hypothetical protein